jgi:hypothetical protein
LSSSVSLKSALNWRQLLLMRRVAPILSVAV